ncbi:MAG: CRISPR-associated helicase Cas3' [Chloroflexi bacterium]|nr:MAG: CRISPR-associated helicase Cas3' [Chloroflexota bacterium]
MDNDTLKQSFKEMFGFPAYNFQIAVAQHLFNGRNVILQAPTGSGKTKAALFPLLYAWSHLKPEIFPHQGVYVTPLRVLANQFSAEFKHIAKGRDVRIQTGEHGDDPRFEADLIFTTIDQFLSSFLTIPYSLGNRLANLNAGAVISSYLVFDEFHLFPVDNQGRGALATTLHILKMLKGITPFVLMTATFSKTLIDCLCQELDAEKVVLNDRELQRISSQKKRYRYVAQPLDADAVLNDMQQNKRNRVICVCNTVERAQSLAQALRNDSRSQDLRVELLHSRFYASDRAQKELGIRREFGKDKSQYQQQTTILVATQVIEVGLDITSDALHTEMAPASALIQRAGRCARFAGETGDIVIYDVPHDEQGVFNYAPYTDQKRGDDNHDFEGQFKLCERTREVCQTQLKAGEILTYTDELALIDKTHTPFDEQMLSSLKTNRHFISESIKKAIAEQDRRTARDLIRDVDNRQVIIHPDPETIQFPYHYEMINLRQNMLLAWCGRALDEAKALKLEWIIKVALPVKDDEKYQTDTEAPEQVQVPTIQWWSPPFDTRNLADAVVGGGIIAINPRLVQYDSGIGFRFGGNGKSAPESPLAPRTSRQQRELKVIHRETYAEHIEGLYRVYQGILQKRTAAAQRRLEKVCNLQEGLLDRSIRLMFATHDLGKLDETWQKWAHTWQEKVSKLRSDPTLRISEEYMAAHTDYDESNSQEKQAERTIQPRRPPHATESARAAYELIAALTGDNDALCVALISAIICHHNAALRDNHGAWKPVPKHAKTAFNQAMKAVGLFNDPTLIAAVQEKTLIDWEKGFNGGQSLSSALINTNKWCEVILYLFLVRILRLADQGSQVRPEPVTPGAR